MREWWMSLTLYGKAKKISTVIILPAKCHQFTDYCSLGHSLPCNPTAVRLHRNGLMSKCYEYKNANYTCLYYPHPNYVAAEAEEVPCSSQTTASLGHSWSYHPTAVRLHRNLSNVRHCEHKNVNWTIHIFTAHILWKTWYIHLRPVWTLHINELKKGWSPHPMEDVVHSFASSLNPAHQRTEEVSVDPYSHSSTSRLCS